MRTKYLILLIIGLFLGLSSYSQSVVKTISADTVFLARTGGDTLASLKYEDDTLFFNSDTLIVNTDTTNIIYSEDSNNVMNQDLYVGRILGDTIQANSSGGLYLIDSAGTKGLFIRDNVGVGINNTSPAYTLDVGGAINTSSQIQIGGYISLAGSTIQYTGNTHSNVYFQTKKSTGDQMLYVENDDATYKLNVTFENDMYVDGELTVVGNTLLESLSITESIDVGGVMNVDTIQASSSDGLYLLDETGTKGIFIEDGGQVGINDVSPEYTLDVGGTIGCNSSLHVGQYVYLGGATIKYDGDIYSDVFLQTNRSIGNSTLHIENEDAGYELDVVFENDIDVGGDLIVDGSVTTGVTTVNASTYDVLDSDNMLDVTYSLTGECTITIPTDLLITGKELEFSDGGGATTYNITVVTEGIETISGSDSVVIDSNYGGFKIKCVGTDWRITNILN